MVDGFHSLKDLPVFRLLILDIWQRRLAHRVVPKPHKVSQGKALARVHG